MAQPGQRKCLCCGLFSDPDPHNRERQRYCSGTDCRCASKVASQATWLQEDMATTTRRLVQPVTT